MVESPPFLTIILPIRNEVGYIGRCLEALCTSRSGFNSEKTSLFALLRIGVRQTSTRADFDRYCRFSGMPERLRWVVV